MILRRVAEHVKAQNWFAVAIDFVIVVVGVFIGIQVSNWNEAAWRPRKGGALPVRADRRLERGPSRDRFDQAHRGSPHGRVGEVSALTGIEPRRTLTFDGGTRLSIRRRPSRAMIRTSQYSVDEYADTRRIARNIPGAYFHGDLGLIRNRDPARETQTYYEAMTEANNLKAQRCVTWR